jgi:hypothetical protein
MNKLNISIGILSWKSPLTLENTLTTYHDSGLLHMVNDVTIFIQEADTVNMKVAEKFGVSYIPSDVNIGIGKAFTALCEFAETDHILILEDDWINLEDTETTYNRLAIGYNVIEDGSVDVVKYRHRRYPGDPLYTRQFAGREMDSPKHLFECLHWRENPHLDFPNIIVKDTQRSLFYCDSMYANHTNNPCMWNKKFYLENISPFAGDGVALEGAIDGWWQEQGFVVAHGEGLFKHFRIDR